MADRAAGGGALDAGGRLHLVGIGGSGMASLAELLAFQGKSVTGSDLSSGATHKLGKLGIRVWRGHRAEHLGAAEVVIVSAAVPRDNPELQEARRRGLPVLTHAEALGELMAVRTGVAVAGTHGKSTTTALLGWMLARAGLDPTILVGAHVPDFGGGARLGRGSHLVVEADEYARRFLSLRPSLALITGIEADHLDYFSGLDEIVGVFRAFAERLSSDGCLVTCADDSILSGLAFAGRRVSYGRSATADWRLLDYQPRPGGGCDFELVGPVGRARARLRLSGSHNALNALGAAAAACELGVALPEALAAAEEFQGTGRRFETAWRADGIWVVDDYAHHPTAVRATLGAAREVHSGRLWAVFQPHTANRVAELLDEFATCFEAADRLLLLPIYQPPGRLDGGRAVTIDDLAARVRGPAVEIADSNDDGANRLAAQIQPGDLVLVMGAGDVTALTCRLVERLRSGEVRTCPRS